jgi:hypothetical protein
MSRILSVGYGIDLTRTSITWCKMKSFIGVSISLISLSFSCLATIDQFFATSQSAYLRRFSNIKWAHRIVFIVNIIWCFYGIPVLLFYDISPITKSCVVSNSAYTIYFTIYVIGLLCTIPALVMVVFGYLEYRNIHLTRGLAEQQADHQLTRMILIEVVLVFICFVPFDINNVYNMITSSVSKDTNRLMIENLAYTIFTLMSYFYYAVCLVIFCKIINQIFLGKLLHVFDIIKSFSSINKRSNILLFKTKSSNSISTAYTWKSNVRHENNKLIRNILTLNFLFAIICICCNLILKLK